MFRLRVLILDEPDSHLHPDNQRALCNLILRVASERNFQALISTHSSHVLNALIGKGGIIWLSKGVIVDEPDVNTTAMLLELGALDSVDYFANGALKCVVATEDSDKTSLQAFLWSNGFVEADTEVASYAGCSKTDTAIVLGRFLKDKAAHLELIIHCDTDHMDADRLARFEQRLRNAGLQTFLTEYSDIEGYFLNPEHLNYLNPAVSVERVCQLIETATAETRDESIAALVNARTELAFQSRRETGEPPNHGKIATDAVRDYDSDPTRYRRGKKVVGKLAALLQEEIRMNPRIFLPSPFLKSDRVASLARQIWNDQAGDTIR